MGNTFSQTCLLGTPVHPGESVRKAVGGVCVVRGGWTCSPPLFPPPPAVLLFCLVHTCVSKEAPGKWDGIKEDGKGV